MATRLVSSELWASSQYVKPGDVVAFTLRVKFDSELTEEDIEQKYLVHHIYINEKEFKVVKHSINPVWITFDYIELNIINLRFKAQGTYVIAVLSELYRRGGGPPGEEPQPYGIRESFVWSNKVVIVVSSKEEETPFPETVVIDPWLILGVVAVASVVGVVAGVAIANSMAR